MDDHLSWYKQIHSMCTPTHIHRPCTPVLFFFIFCKPKAKCYKTEWIWAFVTVFKLLHCKEEYNINNHIE